VTPSWATDLILAMEAVVRSFPPGSAAGPSGLRPQHLLDCLNSADSDANTCLLEALLTLVTKVSAGRLQPRAAPYLCAARLIPLKKKDEGVRPIAVGDTLRRLTAKWLLATSQGRSASAALAPLQIAFAKGSPCEGLEMDVQALAETRHVSTGWLLLQVDLNNALNSPRYPGCLGAAVPVHAALGTSGLPSSAPASGARGHMVDPGGAAGRPLGPFSTRHGHPGSPRRPATRWRPPQVVPG